MFRRLMIPFVLSVWLFMAGIAFAWTINFAWDRNTEPDMSHYIMYRCPGGSECATPSTRTALGTIPHPTSGDTVTWSYVFTPPPGSEETYYFACTAVDTSGNESGPSNIVSTKVDTKAPAMPKALRILGTSK